MAEEAKRRGYTFPYLYDETQAVAKAYRAACTPDFYVFDRHRRLAYRGQMDSSRPGNGLPVTGEDLRAALDAVLAGRRRPRPEGQHGLQHQVEARQRAGLLQVISPFRALGYGVRASVHFRCFRADVTGNVTAGRNRACCRRVFGP